MQKILIYIGAALIFLGLIYNYLPLGKLPGDIIIKKDNFTFYFPIVTSILISLILALIFYIKNQ